MIILYFFQIFKKSYIKRRVIMKLYIKIQILLLIGLMLIINPVSASGGYADEYVAYNSHIDINAFSVCQGDSKNIKAELWKELDRGFFRDVYLRNSPLNFTILDKYNNTISTKIIKTNFMGNAYLKFDTKNLTAGYYQVIVRYEGTQYNETLHNGIFMPETTLHVTINPSIIISFISVVPKSKS